MIATNVRTLATMVRQRRKALDWSQDRLAAAAGVSRPWISAFESGKATVEVGLVFAVLDALGMHVNVISSSTSQAPAGAADAAPFRKSPAGRKSAAKKPRTTAKRPVAAAQPAAAASSAQIVRPPITVGGKSISAARARGSTGKPTRKK